MQACVPGRLRRTIAVAITLTSVVPATSAVADQQSSAGAAEGVAASQTLATASDASWTADEAGPTSDALTREVRMKDEMAKVVKVECDSPVQSAANAHDVSLDGMSLLDQLVEQYFANYH